MDLTAEWRKDRKAVVRLDCGESIRQRIRPLWPRFLTCLSSNIEDETNSGCRHKELLWRESL